MYSIIIKVKFLNLKKNKKYFNFKQKKIKIQIVFKNFIFFLKIINMASSLFIMEMFYFSFHQPGDVHEVYR